MTEKSDRTVGEVRLSGRLICASEKDAKIVRDYLPEHVRLTRKEPGCISFEVSKTDDPMIWRVEECFRDRKAFELHQQRTRYSAWWFATASIPREYKVTGLK
ncbi:putative quinol monooxygenase [Roseovarius aestuarii]|uniref:putative quinol monooxygenase n=1 Tax=Roseovarius aestuarii TaxID=475083 RepID=UPI000A26A46E|nr:antibiotic biosynthesis monooxygenase [Roseovarius aestuarii]